MQNETGLTPRKTNDPAQARLEKAIYLDQRIQSSLYDLMLTLKEFRDSGYYKELGYETLKEYVKDRIPYSYSLTQNLLVLSDKMNDEIELSGKDKAEIFGLSKIANNPDVFKIYGSGKVLLADGNEMSIEEYEALRADDIAKETKVYKEAEKAVGLNKDLSKKAKQMERSQELDQKMIGEQSQTIAKLQETVNYIASNKDIAEKTLQAITTKMGAHSHLIDLYVSLEKAVATLNTIDESIKGDHDIAGLAKQFRELLKISVAKVNDIWSPHFFALEDHSTDNA